MAWPARNQFARTRGRTGFEQEASRHRRRCQQRDWRTWVDAV